MQNLSRIILAILLFELGSGNATANANEMTQPNVVIFLSDDLSWRDCSPNGGKEVPTPNMTRLAKQGMTFSHAFVASPSCAPSRGALLTGLDPMRNGAMLNHSEPRVDVKRWPKYFQELGYEVAAIGKVAHYAQVTRYGFDHCSHFRYHEDTCIEEAVRWLKDRKSEKPLCLFVGTNWPHVPWPKESPFVPGKLTLPPRMIDTPEYRQALSKYRAAVTLADRDLGQVYDAAVAKFGDRMLFAFSSDHGAQMPFAKWNAYDTGLRTPLTVVWPGIIKPDTRTDAMVSWIDFLPTCLEACGAPSPADLDGQSFLPVLKGEKNSHRSLVFGTHSADAKYNRYPIRTVRSPQFRYIRNLAPEAEHHTHIDGDPKGEGTRYWNTWVEAARRDPAAKKILEQYLKRPAEELYDLASDPDETKNLAADFRYAEPLRTLRTEVDRWMTRNNDKGIVTEKELLDRLDKKQK